VTGKESVLVCQGKERPGIRSDHLRVDPALKVGEFFQDGFLMCSEMVDRHVWQRRGDWHMITRTMVINAKGRAV
jgi:hypothetical protein